MNKLIAPGERSGNIRIPASKSQAHRLLICAALSEGEKKIFLDGMSEDIKATADCLEALSAGITAREGCLVVSPVSKSKAVKDAALFCKESGSTLRFLLPVAGALGAEGCFHMEGRLAERPQEVFINILNEKGMEISAEGKRLNFKGRLEAGEYIVPGNISSQYISGLLFALPLLKGNSRLKIEGEIQSADYIRLTEEALLNAGIMLEKTGDGYSIKGGQTYSLPEETRAEGDWSNAAVFLCAGALSEAGVSVSGLNAASAQGDKRVIDILKGFGADVDIKDDEVTVKRNELKALGIDAADIPDIIPALSVVAACAEGRTVIKNAERLRLKESDRLSGTADILRKLGADIAEEKAGLVINGKRSLAGGRIDPLNDHRMAMMAALAACACSDAVEIEDAECVNKSYPGFFEDFDRLKTEAGR